MTIVAILERGDCRANVLDILEDAAMDGLLLQGSVESLSHAIGLRLGDEGEARGEAPELDLVEEVIGRVLRAVIHRLNQSILEEISPECSLEGLMPKVQYFGYLM